VGKKRVRVESSGSELRIVPMPRTAFPIADAIYLTNMLPGERIPEGNGFFFDYDEIGANGLSELLSYLQSEGYEIDLDERAAVLAEKISRDRKDLAQSIRTGALLKKKPGRHLRVGGLRRPLKLFQIPAVAHMIAVEHAANFSVPGSGKTTIALAAFSKLKSSAVVNTLVVIGPRASFAPWENEFRECLGTSGSVVRITGNKVDRIRAWSRAEDADLVLLNYHIAANDRAKLADLLRLTDTMLLLDESHHVKNIKEGKWTSAVRAAAPFAKKRVIMSGTPTPNSVLDIWSQFSFLYPTDGPLGTKEQFIFRVASDSEGAREDVRRTVWPLFWRIKKKDLSLPRPKVTTIRVHGGEAQTAIYRALAAKILREVVKAPVEIDRLRQWRRARIIRLLQAASNPTLLAKYSEEFKLPPLAASGLSVSELIDRYPDFEVPTKITKAISLVNQLVRQGKKVVVWTSFVHNIKMLLRLLGDASPLPLYGGIPLSEEENVELNREKIIERFCSDSSSMILIANPAACAESISLHKACRNAIYLDRTFNCAHFLQSKDRIHRLGLKPNAEVNYYLLLSKGTIDEVVDQRLVVKQRQMLQLLEADFASVDLDLHEDAVSEEGEEDLDFAETLKHIASSVRDDK
jgi:SNF2 family DNA or RNA helicase